MGEAADLFDRIKKRDGREASFDDSKITDAIFKAARAVGGEDRETAVELTLEVLRKLKKQYNGQVFGVEDVQDIVEKVLIEKGHARTAKAYILYRDRRTRLRDAKGELMDVVEEIVKETDKDNANVGNCVKYDTKIVNPTSGELLTIADIVQKGRGDVLSLSGNRVAPSKVVDVFDSGVQECFKVTTKLGKVIECTRNHPLFTLNGWIKLERLSIGSRIGIPSIIPVDAHVQIRDCEVKLLGYLIGDGGLTEGSPTFTCQNRETLKDFTKAASEFGGIRLSLKKSVPSCLGAPDTLYYRIARTTISGSNPLTEFIRSHGLYGKTAHHKFVPDILFRLDNRQLRLFLGALYATDGSLNVSNDLASVSYSTVSERLARGVQHLLLRLGIVANLSKRKTFLRGKACAPSYVVDIRSREFVRLFCEKIRVTGKPADKVLELVDRRTKSGGRNRNTLPSEVRQLLIEAQQISGMSWKELSSALGYTGPRIIMYNAGYYIAHDKRNRSVSRDIVRVAGKVFSSDKLLELANSDIYWDEIENIEPIGKHQVYDIAVAGAANFVGNDVFLHNSPSAKMLQIASAASRKYYLTRLIDEDFSLAHSRGDVHIHDLDFYATTCNCLQIPLEKLLMEGFNTGHGHIRPPKRPASATSLAAIILQSSQNDMFGGQSFPFFDKQIAPSMDGADEDKVYQAMEALVFNLNSMHCLPYREQIWIFDIKEQKMMQLPIGLFVENFEPNRYKAISLNVKTGESELKYVTAVQRKGNHRRLITLIDEDGKKVTTTDNHRIMCIDNQNRITSAFPEQIINILSPENLSSPLISKIGHVNVKQSVESSSNDEYVYDISVADNETFLTASGIFVHNSRAGSQVPFSSINLGTDTSEDGRRVTRNFLLAYESGLGRGENPIFPNVIFRAQKGVSLDPQDPNYDLFQLAVRVASKRLNPTFSFMDSSFNKPYDDQVAYMGCRTRTMDNRHGPSVTTGRGNLSFTTINLPRLGIKAERNMKTFYKLLDEVTELTINQLYHRFQVQCRLKVKDLPFVMGQNLYLGSEGLKPDDSIEPAIVNGTLTVGFIGLAEMLVALTGYHHGQNKESQQLGLEIVDYIKKKVDEASECFNLNYTLLATPARGCAAAF